MTWTAKSRTVITTVQSLLSGNCCFSFYQSIWAYVQEGEKQKHLFFMVRKLVLKKKYVSILPINSLSAYKKQRQNVFCCQFLWYTLFFIIGTHCYGWLHFVLLSIMERDTKCSPLWILKMLLFCCCWASIYR